MNVFGVTFFSLAFLVAPLSENIKVHNLHLYSFYLTISYVPVCGSFSFILCVSESNVLMFIHSFIHCKTLKHTTNGYERFQKKQWKIKICTRIRNNKNTKGNFKTRNTLKCATVITYVGLLCIGWWRHLLLHSMISATDAML